MLKKYLRIFVEAVKAPFVILWLSCVALALASCTKPPTTDTEKASYFVGQQIGTNLKKQNLTIDQEMVQRGVKDALSGKELAMKADELREAQQIFNRLANSAIQQEREKRQVSAEEFLETNKKNAGWVTTPSGLQYKVLKAGKGRRPGPTSTVHVHYVGTLQDGARFDASRGDGKPTELKVNSVIKGWSEALKLMNEGSHWILVLPPSIAYGASGHGPIPPNSVLIFDVQLVKVK